MGKKVPGRLLPVMAAVVIFFLSPAAHAYRDARLVEAARAGDAGEVLALLSRNADVNSRDGRGATALMRASGGGYVYIVNKLLAAGADVRARDNDGKTALNYAAENNQAYIGQLLLAAGAPGQTVKLDNTTSAMPAGNAGGQPVEGEAVNSGQGGAGCGVSSEAGAGVQGASGQGPKPRGGYSQTRSSDGGAGFANSGPDDTEPRAQGGGTTARDIQELKKMVMKALKLLALAGIVLLGAIAAYRASLFSRLLKIFDGYETVLKNRFAARKAYSQAWLAQKSKRYQDAAVLYERALKFNPQHLLARFHLAKIYHNHINDPAAARRHYRIVISQLPAKHAFHKDARASITEMGSQQDQ